jgi:hypothetical protein
MSNASAEVLKAADQASTTVFVACKLPHGIVIRDFVETIVHEPVLGGGARKVKLFRAIGRRIRIKGPVVPPEFIRLVEVHGGYAITEGVPADVWRRWIEWNKDSDFVRNQMIYGNETKERLIGWAKERAALKSGTEPLDVSMKRNEEGEMVFKDERIALAGAIQVVDGKLEPTAA